jgi:hypothetical protein
LEGVGVREVREEKPPLPLPALVVREELVVEVAAARCLDRVERMRSCLAVVRAMRLKIWLASGATGGLELGLSWAVMLRCVR